MSPESKQAFFERQERNIALHGFTTVSVVGEAHSFSYTVGLHKSYHHPEMLVFGLPPKIAQGVLSDIARKVKEGEPFNLSKPNDKLLEDCNVFFVEVPKSAFSNYVLSAIRFNGEQDFSLFQIVWPSGLDNRYPWDLEADPEFVASQPVLGVPAFKS
ncbi:DUF4262 domain-containing protein [Phragmitibacter flavus]|uniref:DUF4262 domain-containing protein n=1 Tax=Phragmitibacter flavus TaxID=2576071 RepID=A0A5R8KFQ7_9BACT|nr:DUF4262 domain-containing protein [Phragmitibacter flavus]TLD70795.1 DUF4262 domain-containing protein [Phragmitibacter flavus]